MKTRILSACIMLPLLLLIYFGGRVLAAGVFIISLMAFREFCACFETAGRKPGRVIGYCGILLLGVLGQLQPWMSFDTESLFLLAGLFLLVAASLIYLFDMERLEPADAFATIAGVLYTGFFPYHVVLVDQSGAPVLIWLIFLSAFGSDIFAYFTGMAIGRHKLCPKISPKKTVEGCIGGLAGAVLLCGLFGWFFARSYFPHCLVLGLAAGAFSQLGDLSASVLKRKAGVKDFGNLIPGHGGILDRFDSVLFTAPLIYYYIAIVLPLLGQ